MSEVETTQFLQYWIFQALPERFDLKLGIKPGEHDSWELNRFQKAVIAGDVVLLWSGGARAGLYGWGNILDVAPADNRASVQYQGVLDAPLLREDLKTYLELSGLTILRNPSGTNFRVTALEAQQLCALMEQARPSPPPLPEKDDEDRHPGGRLLDYRYSNTPVRVLNACVYSAMKSGNDTIFPKLVVQHVLALALNTTTARPDSTAFLREAIPNLASIPLPFTKGTDWASLDTKFDESSLNRIAVKESALRLLATARRAAILSTGRERISLRHLIAAVLHGATRKGADYLAELLSTVEIHPDSLKQQFLAHMGQHWPDDRQDGWATFYKESPSTDSNQRASQLLALLDADAGHGVDHLNIRNEVRAFAALLAAKDARPPLAIGLFGDWGSGKTFFMQQVRKEVRTLAAGARAQGDTDSAFCGRTAQIWFNAWHYSETDLWASLVDHFFRELKTQIEEIDQERGGSRYRMLLKELDLSKEDASQLQYQVERAEQKRQRLTVRRDELRVEIAAKRKVADTLAAMQAQAGDVEDPLALTALRERAQELEDVLGIMGLKQKTDREDVKLSEVVDLIRDSRHLKSQLTAFYTGVKQSASNVQLLILAIAGIISAYVLGDYLFSNLSGTKTVASMIVALTAAAGFLRQPITLTLSLLKLLRNATRTFDEKKQSQSNRRLAEQQRLNGEIDKLNGEIAALNQRLKTSGSALIRLKSDYQEMLRGSLFEFVLERVGSNQYQEHLGLLSTVRNDFDALDKLMSKQRSDKHDPELPTIDRIILYIDDLDRCPPERVVQVLEAVHLILAFPLFMVVVGVDARWVGRSLKEKYPFLIHFDDETARDKHAADLFAASTDDYLEKIFQVPYWLKPIDSDMAKGLIDGLLEESKKRLKEPDEKTQPMTPPESAVEETGANDETEDEAEGYNEERDSGETTSMEAAASLLSLSEEESLFMSGLAPLVGRSPRTVKRFINLYRLFKASNPKSQAPDFSTASGNFRAPMLLLAVVTGRPRVSNRLFDELDKMDTDEELIQTLARNRTETPDGPSQSTDAESLRWKELNSLLCEFWKNEKNRIPLSELTDWLDDVARFSYREWRRNFSTDNV